MKEIPCLNVYLQNAFLYSKNYQNAVVSTWERRKKGYLYVFCRANDQIYHISFKTETNRFGILQGNTINGLCLYSIRFWFLVPCSNRNFVHLWKLLGFLQMLLLSVYFSSFSTEKTLRLLHFIINLESTIWLLEMTKSSAGEAEYKVPYLGLNMNS